jgi:hypothetical protein
VYHIRDRGFFKEAERQAQYNMLDEGIFDREKNGVLLGINVIAQKNNKRVV